MDYVPSATVVTAATIYPISLSEAKDHLRLSTDHDDLRVRGLIKVATEVLENTTGRSFINRTLRHIKPCFNDTREVIYLPRPPLVSITTLDYFDIDGASQTVASGNYQVYVSNEVQGFVKPEPGFSWPATELNRHNAVTIDYVAGYGTERTDVPESARQWMLMLIRHWYDNPSAIISGQTSKELELSARALSDSLGWGYYADV